MSKEIKDKNFEGLIIAGLVTIIFLMFVIIGQNFHLINLSNENKDLNILDLEFIAHKFENLENQSIASDINYCKEYANLNKVEMQIFEGETYVLINGDYINMEKIYGGCKQ